MTAVTDYFLYEAASATAAARSPVLLLLPNFFIPMTLQRKKKHDDQDALDEDVTAQDDQDQDPTPRYLWKENTGILRRRDGEVVVARLEVPVASLRRKAELCVLGTCRLKW